MDLREKVRNYLRDLPRTSFFKQNKSDTGLIGSIKGSFAFILVIDSNRRLTSDEIKFKNKIIRCNGEHYVVRSMDDICILSKVRGWHD